MNKYLFTLLNALQQTNVIPIRYRTKLLKIMGVKTHKLSKVAAGVWIGSNKLELHARTFVNVNCFLDGCDDIILEEGVRLGPFVKLLTGSHTYSNSVYRRDPPSKDWSAPVKIRRGCWLGADTVVLPGVVIAEGCVIGAGSVVVRSTEPNGLYVGNPAKRIKDLPLDEL